jgi:hypothetical protein
MANPTNTTGLHVASIQVGGTSGQSGNSGFIQLTDYAGSPTSTAQRLYSVNGVLYFDGVNLESGGGAGVGTMEEVYQNGRVVGLTLGAIVLNDATAGAANTLEFNKNGAGSGNVIDVDLTAAFTGNVINLDMGSGIAAVGMVIDSEGGARTGADLFFIDDSTGAHSLIDINCSGSGASIAFDWTGSFNGNGGGQIFLLTFDANDNLTTEVMQIDTGAGNRGIMFDMNFGHTDAGTTSHIFDIDISGVFDSNVIDFATSAACTGNVINIVLDTGVALTALHIEGAGVRTQPMVELSTTATGAANLIALVVNGAISGNLIDVGVSAAATGNVLDIDMDAGVGGKAIFIDAGNAIRTAALIDILSDGSGNADCFNIDESNTGSGHLFDINISGVGSGNAIDITYSAADTGDALKVVMADNLAGGALVVTAAGVRTDNLIEVTTSETGAVDGIMRMDVSGVFTGNVVTLTASGAATTGALIHLDLDAGVAYKGIIFDHAGARTSATMLATFDGTVGAAAGGTFLDANITMTGAAAAPFIDVDVSGVYTGHIFDVNFSAAATGNAINIAMGSNVAGNAILVTSAATGANGVGSIIDVEHTGALVAGADCITVHSTGNISSTSNLLALEQDTGAGSAGANCLYIDASGTNVEAVEINAGILFEATVTADGVGNDETLSTAANISFYDPGASRTGVILTAGLRDGQRVTVVNIADAAEDITFAAAGVSNVAGGASVVISQFESCMFTWSATTSLWYAEKLT